MERHSLPSQEEMRAFAAPYGSEMKVPVGSDQPGRMMEKRHCLQQSKESPIAEKASALDDLAYVAEWMKDTSKPHSHEGNSRTALLHDHNRYCIPEEPTALKNLVTDLKNTVHCQRELLLSLQEAGETSQKELHNGQEKADDGNWTLISGLGERISQLEAENRKLRCERDNLESTGRRLRKELDASGATVLSMSRQLGEQHKALARHGAFSLESVKSNAKWLRFYTGFARYPCLVAFLDFLLGGKKGEEGSPDNGLHSALSPENQLFLVLVRLRLGLLLQDLAFRFHVSESTASRYWLSWTEIMEQRLRQCLKEYPQTCKLRLQTIPIPRLLRLEIPVTYSQRYIDAFKPQRRLRLHDVSLVALDCAELCFEAQRQTRGKRDAQWGPRARYSVQGYALAAPSGFLTFGAGTNEELPALPPFLQEGPVDLTAQEEAEKKQVLSLRSLTDKAFSFRFLRIVHPQNMEAQVSRAWVISCYLACLLHEPMGLA